jgi:hypothetical protein
VIIAIFVGSEKEMREKEREVNERKRDRQKKIIKNKKNIFHGSLIELKVLKSAVSD